MGHFSLSDSKSLPMAVNIRKENLYSAFSRGQERSSGKRNWIKLMLGIGIIEMLSEDH